MALNRISTKKTSIKYSAHVLDNNIAPKLSTLTTFKVPALRKYPNYFATLFLGSVFVKRYPQYMHILLVVFLRRIEFAGDQYHSGSKKLKQYIDLLPQTNSKTRLYRTALSHFETCALHTYAAVCCLQAIGRAAELPPMFRENDGSDYDRLRRLSNRIRHFDEDVVNKKKIQKAFPLTPVWLTNDGLETTAASLAYVELHEILKTAMIDAKMFTQVFNKRQKK